MALRTQEAECSSVEGTLAQQALLCGGDLDSLESFSCSLANGHGARDSSYESCSASAQTRRSDAVREAVASVMRWRNERETLYVDDFATENTYDTMVLDGITYTGLTGPDQVAATSDSVISWETDFGTTHKRG